MKKIRWIVTVLAYSLATTPLYSHNDEIVVHLQTESRLIPVYVSHIDALKPDFEKAYVNLLESVLRFDFLNNGTTQLIDFTTQREELAKRTGLKPAELLTQWKGTGATYLVVPTLNGKELSARLLNVSNGIVKEIAGIALSGKLAEDRRQLHRLSDALHLAISGIPGIASTRILYTIKTKGTGSNWASEVWESDYDGANARQITRSGDYCVTPSYIPPKAGGTPKQFIYVSYGIGQPRILYASLEEGKGQRMTTAKGNQLTPTLSRQRDKLGFVCDVAGNPDLYIQPFDPESGRGGKMQLIFSGKGATESTPTFHPNGREIAFTSDKDGAPRIYTLEIPQKGKPAGKPALISKRAINGSSPAWSPDGKKIAFCSLTQGTRQIWVYDQSKAEEKQITFSPGHKENPSWAPNSLHIVYNTASPSESELYFVDLNRMKPVKISSGQGEKRFPNWEPR